MSTGLFVSMLEEGSSLFYYHKDSGPEIDLITPIDTEVKLVEVKAKNGNAKSAITVLKNKDQYGVNRCIKLSANNVGQKVKNWHCRTIRFS